MLFRYSGINYAAIRLSCHDLHKGAGSETMGKSQTMNTVSFRGYLVLLHVMFLVLYGSHLQLPLPVTGLHGGMVIILVILAVLTMMVLTVPRTQLAAPWFISVIALGNASVMFGTMPNEPGTEAGRIGGVIFLLAMASYISSVPHFAMVSGLLVSGYGMSLYQADLLQTPTVLLLPAFLCVTLVFLSKIGIFQAEIQRMADVRSRHASMKDALTGLANRTQFLEQVTRLMQYRHVNRNFHFAVLFIDLDGFKPINDTFGHKAGDVVLRHVAKLLQACVRKGDLVGRYGGDEFTVLLNHVKAPSDAVRVAQTILSKLQTPIPVGETVKVGASIGIALSTNPHERAEDLIRDADAAMYRAKAQGKNGYAISDQSDIDNADLKERWRRITQLQWSSREH
jgi:diguanylate cyclase (GGDEF)-like protein